MEKESTSILMNILKSTDRRGLKAYRKQYLSGGPADFTAYMDDLIRVRKLKRQDIFQRADLPQKYGYKLLSGECHTTDRDKLLRLFIAMGLSLREVQRGLKLYGMSELYPKFARDAVLIIAINQGVRDVDTVNEWLSEEGERELSRSAD